MTETERLSILTDYSLGKLGTRATIDRLDLDDYADLVIALATRGLHLPRSVETPALAEHRARAWEILQPRLMRER